MPKLYILCQNFIYNAGVLYTMPKICIQNLRILLRFIMDMNLGFLNVMMQVKPHYERGAIESVIDRRLGEEYNISSIWKVAEIAMACVEYEGIQRPTMTVVCNELMEALRLESVKPHGVSASSTSDVFSTPNVQAR